MDSNRVVESRLSPPLDDPVYRALTAMRDRRHLRREILAAWEREGAAFPDRIKTRMVLTHYKPWDRGRAIVRVKVERPGRKPALQHLYVQVYAEPEAARRRIEGFAKRPLRCVGPAVFLLADETAVAWALPNGPMLRTAKMFLRRGRFARFLSEAGLVPPSGVRRPKRPKLLRYVPRRRAVFRHSGPLGDRTGALYFKLYAPGLDEGAAASLSRAREASRRSGARFTVPDLVAHVRKRRAIAMEGLPGRRLSHHSRSANEGAFRVAGAALAALHRTDLALPGPAWSDTTEVEDLRAAMADVVRALPALRLRIDELVEEISARRRELSFPVGGPIHGNMFGDQVLVDGDGTVGIVDWDDFRRGDPLFDLGRLQAGTLFLSDRRSAKTGGAPRNGPDPIEALRAGYEEAGGVVDAERLQWHLAAALLLRAKISALRPLPETWIPDIERAVGRAEAVLAASVRGDRS